MMAEQDIIGRLSRGKLALPPLEFGMDFGETCRGGDAKIDVTVEAQWQGRTWRFSAEVKRTGTPMAMQRTGYIRQLAAAARTYPMVIVPYLSPGALKELERARVSGLDLCGNGVVIVPGELLVVRTGKPNRFPQSDIIKNVYRGKTSIVARAFLVRPRYEAVKEIVALANERGGRITFSTVSKALKRLEEDLVIGRGPDGIRLLQADKILERLARDYVPPRIRDRFVGKCNLPKPEMIMRLESMADLKEIRLVLTGSASVERYAVAAPEPIVSLYCSEPPDLWLPESGVEAEPTERFANLELLQTDDDRIYFDLRREKLLLYSSPVQAWLELARGDKRQQDAAEQVKAGILSSLGFGNGQEDSDAG